MVDPLNLIRWILNIGLKIQISLSLTMRIFLSPHWLQLALPPFSLQSLPSLDAFIALLSIFSTPVSLPPSSPFLGLPSILLK